MDGFEQALGTTRGANRKPGEDSEVIMAADLRRRTLALVAAHGILGHNVAVPMPDSFTAGRVAALLEHGGRPNLPTESDVPPDVLEALQALTADGLLSFYKSAWKVTPAGLVALWTGADV